LVKTNHKKEIIGEIHAIIDMIAHTFIAEKVLNYSMKNLLKKFKKGLIYLFYYGII
jgi:hypothetical protein